jgi:hypothetical protein
MKSRLLFFSMCSFSLSACVPAVVEKSPPAVGRVTDARTHRPVADAHVSLPDSDVPGTTTDSDGRFSLPYRSKLGLVVLLPFDPARREVPLEVKRAHYQPFRTTVPFYVYREPKPLDVALQPTP